MAVRKGITISEEDAKLYDELIEKSNYYERLQFCTKIRLNSTYGCLTNYNFRFFRLESGESVTGTGRMILRHQCRKVSELLDGIYHTNFPLYETVAECVEHNCSPELALHGPVFKGKFPSESVVYGDSVGAESIIITNMGDKQIQDLFVRVDNAIGGKEYYHPIDVQTLTYDEHLNKTTFSSIKYIMRHKVAKKMYRIWISNTNYVDVTEDHSLICYQNTNNWNPGESRLVCTTPTELILNTKSLIHLKHIPRNNIVSRNYSKEVYELLGYILGDGGAEKTVNGGVGLSIGAKDLVEVRAKLLTPLRDQGIITSIQYSANTHDVRLCGAKLWYLVNDTFYFHGGRNKVIPEWIFNETEENICSFLRGYFSADGSAGLRGNVSIGSVTKQHIMDTQKLLFYCGIASNYFTEGNENQFNGKFSGTYSVVLHVKDAPKYAERIGFILDRKQSRVKTTYALQQKLLHQYDYSICRATKIEVVEYDDYVYDIEVENTHTFFANNILVHNTDSVYFKTHAQTNEDAIKIADIVADKVNESFAGFLKEAFLCQPGYDQNIKSGREVVSDRGIFVDKKRYMLHIIDNEGQAVDKLKIMGLELKKTTLPKPVQQALTKFIERLLKGATWDSIATEVVAYKKDLIGAQDVLTIGLPKGVNNVETYTESYVLNNSCRLPGHVAAAIFYNIQLEENGDLESPAITSGMKLKVYYLKRKFGKFKSIALPTDIDKVPSWFNELFLPLIDRDAQLYRLVDKPLEHILNAIGERVPTAQLLHVKELFTF